MKIVFGKKENVKIHTEKKMVKPVFTMLLILLKRLFYLINRQ